MSDKEIVKTDKNVDIVEAGDAAANMATIATKPTDISRTDLISKLVAYAAKADKEDLANFIASIGGEAAANASVPDNDTIFAAAQAAGNGSGDNSAKNAASIKSSGKHADPMPSIKEDLALVFGDSEDLSEDFRLKVSTLFEAAVSTRVNMEVAKLEEETEAFQAEIAESYQQTLEESINEIKEEMVENVDNYLNYAVAEWISENKLAIESNIRTQVAESFMVSLKNVFEEHYVNIPDDQVDVVEAMAAELEDLKSKVNSLTEENIELSKTVSEKEIQDVTDSLSEGMTNTQKEKFAKLAEAVNFSNVGEFRKKISIIKETYFPKNQEVKVAEDQLLSETVEEPVRSPSLDPDMQTYVSSITRTLKK
jgi:FtsZ-binding cell division protein ZapB